jgi:hypothetical protein
VVGWEDEGKDDWQWARAEVYNYGDCSRRAGNWAATLKPATQHCLFQRRKGPSGCKSQESRIVAALVDQVDGPTMFRKEK